MDQKLNSLKNYLNEANTLLNYVQFKSLLENTKGSKTPTNVILQYTQNLDEFAKFIKEDVYPNVRNRSIKHRCTTLLKSIKNPSEKITPSPTPINSDEE